MAMYPADYNFGSLLALLQIITNFKSNTISLSKLALLPRVTCIYLEIVREHCDSCGHATIAQKTCKKKL